MKTDHPFHKRSLNVLNEQGEEGCATCGRPRSVHSLVTDRNDDRLGYGVDPEPRPQHEAYLVLSDEERAKGFVRPVRNSYIHVGIPGPSHGLRDLTPEEHERYDAYGYVKFEPYEGDGSVLGRFWSQEQLDRVNKGCGTVTTMSQAIAETYARDPSFYGATYCVRCQQHLPVGRDGEFVWDGPYDPVTGEYDTERVGT